MHTPSLLEEKVFSVSECVSAITAYLEQGLGVIMVQGEVSGFRVSRDQLLFFELKDATSRVQCFMMKWDLHMPLEDGMEVTVIGVPKLFQKSGGFHIRVRTVELVGMGALQRAFEMLKATLEKEGVFAPERKRPLPRFPEHIGIVTSEDAAAYTDVLRILKNRWSGLCITTTHVGVQGARAVPEIVDALRWLNTCASKKPDVLIVTRGGGSLEDLQAFNSEDVVRAIFASHIPVVVGVGHERDVTLADMVADVRAATPSNAAELVVPDRREIQYQIETMIETMETTITTRIRHRMTMALRALFSGAQTWVTHWKERVRTQDALLRAYSPQAILDRGYSMTLVNGKILLNAARVKRGATLDTRLARGSIRSLVQ